MMASYDEPLSIVVERHDYQMLVRLRGELDIATAPALADALSEADSEVVVDFAGLTFLDVSGLHVLARSRERAEQHGNGLVVINAGPFARHMFHLTGLDSLLSGSDAR